MPWKLQSDMQFFKKLTATTQNQSKLNAVIMGRKTFDALPPRVKPLPQRINVVVSSACVSDPACASSLLFSFLFLLAFCSQDYHPVNPDHFFVTSFDEALQVVSASQVASRVESVFVMGGRQSLQVLSNHLCAQRFFSRDIQGI